MHEHLAQVEALLGLSLANLPEERAALINKLAGDIWDILREYGDDYKLDLREMFAISLTTHYALTEIMITELEG